MRLKTNLYLLFDRIMADNLSETSSYWNGRFGETINLNYAELFNVDPVDVPYSNIGRVKSYFLQTRGAYVEDLFTRAIANFLDNPKHKDFTIADAKIIRDEDCYQKDWKIWVSYVDTNKTTKKITCFRIEDNQIIRDQNQMYRIREYPIDECTDNRLHKIDYVKHEINNEIWQIEFYQENVTVDWGSTQWYIGSKVLDEYKYVSYIDEHWNRHDIRTMSDFMNISWIQEWDYILVNSSDDKEDSGSCWQVRQILWTDPTGMKIWVSSQWLWLKLPEEWETSIKWYGIKISFYHDWWETIVFASLRWLHVVSETWLDDTNWYAVTMCGYGISMSDEKRVIADMEVYNNRLCVLLSNWYIWYWMDWYNLFYLTTDNLNYVGKDKLGLISRRDILLIFWKNKIDVWSWDENNNSLVIYTQTKVIWVHNKYSFWEYEGSICFISSEAEPRLLAITINNKVSVHDMLTFEDIGWYIQTRLNKIRDTDEIFLSTMWNDLKIYVNCCSAPNLCHYNNCTRIFMFNKRFQVWYEHFTHSIIHWNIENIYYGTWLIYNTKYKENWDIFTTDVYYTPDSDDENRFNCIEREELIKTSIVWYINENEYNNWQVDANGWPIDLFRIIKMKSLNLLLWYWIYSDNTKLTITNYRFWLWSELVIDNIWKNKGVDSLSRLANGKAPDEIITEEDKEKVACMYDDVSDNEVMEETCDNKLTLSDVERQKMLWYQNMSARSWAMQIVKLNDVWLCVNRWRYTYSNVYPLHINVNETQKPSELIKVALTSEWGDSLSFGWAIVELNVYPLDYVGTDNEYGLTFDEDCPKRFKRDTWWCFKNLID